MYSKGIHHVTAIAGDPQANYDFYSGLLGLKMVKKTINFDDPGTYHFYFGDEDGNPGTILTFFPWGRYSKKGRGGTGQVLTYSFMVPKGSLEYWKEKLKKYKVVFTGPYKRFGENLITFEDADGLEMDLIESDFHNGNAITGFHSATLSVENRNLTESILLDVLGFTLLGNEENRYRYTSQGTGAGRYIDLVVTPDLLPGVMGVGAIHHIAFRAENDDAQLKLREAVQKKLINPTNVIDRKYFHSVYFREPNGILFEIATDPPGFLIDEKKEEMGKKLQLPEWYEPQREAIEKSLKSLQPPAAERIFLSE